MDSTDNKKRHILSKTGDKEETIEKIIFLPYVDPAEAQNKTRFPPNNVNTIIHRHFHSTFLIAYLIPRISSWMWFLQDYRIFKLQGCSTIVWLLVVLFC